jgi:polyisoprenyl-teichoic acid--peptidoglycan teichoic acid transferase
MADGDKPYRLYKGGRTKGKVPTAPRPERRERAVQTPARGPGRPRWGRRIGLAVLVLVVLLVAWTVASYLAFRSGMQEANERLPRTVEASLAAQEGMLASNPSLIMLLGTDGDRSAARQDFRRSDSILLVRTDPARNRLAYLSIPRDLRVDIPGHGTNKINAAFQLGGPALTMRTVRALTGLQPNHVVLVDFDAFKEVIDALGGVTIDVPKPILSNRFDCPYPTEARCQEWQGWRFAKGEQEMSGKRALIYSRVRENRLDAAENDLTRGERQQAVVEAMTDQIVSLKTFVRLPFIGDDLVKPLTTDLSAGQLLQLGWARFRANDGRSLHCRLGGEPQTIGGESVLVATEENTATIAMFTGRSAAQPPPPGTAFGAGCLIGRSAD